MSQAYDTIGLNYAQLRRPDPRIAHAIEAALGSAETVLNVGAGTGSYEPRNRSVTAVEPSVEMIGQRSPQAALAIQAFAENLPFPDNAFDACMAILTVHHWTDQAAGLCEMKRVSRGKVVLLTFDPQVRPWLTDYIPELATLDDARFPAMSAYEDWLGPVRIEPIPIPHDCRDGFLYAYWRRPEAYLDPRLRAGSSSFWSIDAEAGLSQLRTDIETGVWQSRYADLAGKDAYDAGYRLIISK